MADNFFSNPHLASPGLQQDKSKAELIAGIESGEIEHLDFQAIVFKTGKNKNFYRLAENEMPQLSSSFAYRPFLRNHDEGDIASRDGTIISAWMQGSELHQVIRVTTRKGMLSLIEGQIDRFSIGWFYEGLTCSICNSDFRTCNHYPGREYPIPDSGGQKTQCEVIFTGLTGKETSAVNVPAVEGTSILASLKAAASAA